MADYIYSAGTVAVSAGSTAVVGDGTAWAISMVDGGVLMVDGLAVPIASVEDDTHLTLLFAWPGSNGTGKTYGINMENAGAASAVTANRLLADIVARVYAGTWLQPSEQDAVGTLANRDTFDGRDKGFIYIVTETPGVLTAYIKESNSSGDWSDGKQLEGPAGDDGWTPVLATVADGDRRVQQVIDWTGGAGTKPAVGAYVGLSGLTPSIGSATDIRGPVGSGAGDVTTSGTVTSGNIAVYANATGDVIRDGGSLSAYLPKSGGQMTGDLTIAKNSVALLSLTAKGAGGRDYRLASTDNGNGLGGGKLVVYDQTAGAIRLAIGNTGAVSVPGSFAKGSGTFLIDHPLDPAGRDLAHGFVEAPRYDLIYRGEVALEDGRAMVDIDAASAMSPGTFAALTRNATVLSLQNQSGFARLRPGPIAGASFEIICEDEGCTDEVSWLVIAERNDAFVRSDLDPNTDDDGRFIPEREKEDA